MRKSLLLALAALVATTAFTPRAGAQLFRRSCAGGACSTSYRSCYGGSCATARPSTGWRYSYAPTYGYWTNGQCQGGACSHSYSQFNSEYVSKPTSKPCEPVQPTTAAPCATCGEYKPLETESGALVYRSCPSGSCPLANGAGSAVKAVASLLDRANAVRARYGLAALSFDSNLEVGSRYQASFCASRGALIHGGGVAEILAQNSAGFDYALAQWLNSPAHRALLLSPNFRLADAAVYRDSWGRVWCAMRFR